MKSARPLSVFIVGTRAQLIKVAPVMIACERENQAALLLLTGQHVETMQDLIEEFGIRSPQENAVPELERSTVQSLVRWIPRAYLALSRKLGSMKADGRALNVVVHGDTMSTVLGAVAARRNGIKVFHLESGLTSGKLFDPFPEEISRRIVFRVTDVAVCPGAESASYMRKNYRCSVIDTVANTIVDSVMMATQHLDSPVKEEGPQAPYMVASLHRFQNLFDGKRLRFLVKFLSELSLRYPIHFVLHPATKKRLESEGLLAGLSAIPNIRLSPRLGYSAFLGLASRAACVLTDGGSNQEELAVLGVPTIVMRQTTERADGLGENAIMEADLGQGLREYCLSGRFEELRRPSRVKSGMGPSLAVADLLASKK